MRKLVILTILALATINTNAESIDSLFADIPDEEMPLLRRNDRLDLLDLYNGKIKASADNKLGGKTELTHKDNLSLSLKLTSSSSWDMAIFVDGDTTIICNHTIISSGKESVLKAYSPTWQSIEMQMPTVDSNKFFTTLPDSLDNETRGIADKLKATHTTYAELQPDKGMATLRLSTGSLNSEEKKKIEPILKGVDIYWDGKKFSETRP